MARSGMYELSFCQWFILLTVICITIQGLWLGLEMMMNFMPKVVFLDTHSLLNKSGTRELTMLPVS